MFVIKTTLFTVSPMVFLRCLGTRFGTLELKIGSLDSEKIGSLESEKSGP